MLDLEKTLEKVKGEYKTLMDRDVPAYNKQIEGSGLKPLPVTGTLFRLHRDALAGSRLRRRDRCGWR